MSYEDRMHRVLWDQYTRAQGWPLGRCVSCGRVVRLNKARTCIECIIDAASGIRHRREPEPEIKTIKARVLKGPCITPKVIYLGPGGTGNGGCSG